MPGGDRGSSPSAMYPARRQTVAAVTNENRTERHFYTLFGAEDDCWVILAAVTSGHDAGRATLALYVIFDMGLRMSHKTRQNLEAERDAFILHHRICDPQCRIGCCLDGPEVGGALMETPALEARTYGHEVGHPCKT